MIIRSRLFILALATVTLAGCAANTRTPANTGVATSKAPSVAEQACLRDVARTTNNPDVVLLDSTLSQEGTEVIVSVGRQRARWRCIGYGDGTTTVVISLAEERLL